MNKKWIKYLCDPTDKSELRIYSINNAEGDNIISGRLKSNSGNFYKIKNGVPILLTSKTQRISSVRSFAYEWNKFDFDYAKKGWFKDLIRPIVGRLDYFKNKTIVDCGAGSGRQSLWMAESGAKFVFALELSDSAYDIKQRVRKSLEQKIFVIQCDISHIPINIKNVKIDLVYCVNVIQHTKFPQATLVELSRLLNKNSSLIFNIYLEKGRKLFLRSLDLARKVTKYLPFVVLKNMSFLIAVVCFVCSLSPIGGKWFRKSLPIDHGFRETWLSIYDILGSHEYQKFYTEHELGDMLRKSRLQITKRSEYALLLNLK